MPTRTGCGDAGLPGRMRRSRTRWQRCVHVCLQGGGSMSGLSSRTTRRQRGARLWLATLVACWSLMPIAAARAQSTAASLSGVVQDGQGAAIPGAVVTLTSHRRGTTETTTTNGEGFFTIPQLPPDTYTLKVTLEGFKTFERSEVVLTANERSSAGTIALDVGAL